MKQHQHIAVPVFQMECQNRLIAWRCIRCGSLDASDFCPVRADFAGLLQIETIRIANDDCGVRPAIDFRYARPHRRSETLVQKVRGEPRADVLEEELLYLGAPAVAVLENQ